MPVAYLVAQMQIHDHDAFGKYSRAALESIKAHGGEIIIGGKGPRQILEGAEQMPHLAVAVFPSYEQALTWYRSPEYDALAAARREAADGSVYLIEGIGDLPS